MFDSHTKTRNLLSFHEIINKMKFALVKLTNLSSASIFKYLWINDIIELIGLLPSTAHLRFFIIGTFPVAFRSMSTADKKTKIK